MRIDTQFYKQMLKIAIPIALQSLIVSSLNTLDTVMITNLGDATIAGVGLANQVFFFFMMICFGIGTGSSVMIAQYHGRKDLGAIRKVNAFSSILALIVGLIFTVLAVLFPHFIIGLMINDLDVINSGAQYLQVIAFSYMITGFSFANGITLRSTGNPRGPLLASIMSFFFNAFFNYVLIFGKFGFPELGVVGAAVGTIIARTTELFIIILQSIKDDGPLKGDLREMCQFDKPFIKKYIDITAPVIVNETFWALGQVLYSVAYALVGTEATAAIQVIVAIQNIAFVIIRGLSNSCTIILGSTIGRGHLDKVYPYAIRFFKIGTVFAVALGLFMALIPEVSLSLFNNLSAQVYQLSLELLRVMGFLFIIKAFNSILIVGVLRGGGDTRYSMAVEMTSVWLVGVPLAFIGAAILKLPIHWVVVLAAMEEFTKAIIGFIRVRSKKWIHQIE